MSRVPTEWITAPAPGRGALEDCVAEEWNWLSKIPPAPIAYTMYPNWLTVE